MAKKGDMVVSEEATTSVAVKYGDTQLAVYYVPKRGFYATQQMYVGVLTFPWGAGFVDDLILDRCPHRRAFVLDHGIIGDTLGGDLVSYNPQYVPLRIYVGIPSFFF